MSFRKVDVDIDDEDVFIEEYECSSLSPSELEEISRQVKGLLSRGSFNEALKHSLKIHPFGKDALAVKNLHTQSVMDVLMAVKASEIAPLVKELNADELDVLLKYIYKGMGQPEVYNSSILLVWHEKVFEAGGLGSIARVLCDRKVV